MILLGKGYQSLGILAATVLVHVHDLRWGCAMRPVPGNYAIHHLVKVAAPSSGEHGHKDLSVLIAHVSDPLACALAMASKLLS